MSDTSYMIPAMAFMNAQIIQEAYSQRCLDACVNEVRRTHGCAPPEGSYLFYPAHAVSLLYCLLVVPFGLGLSQDQHLELEKRNPLRYFDVELPDPELHPIDAKYLLRRLRNSVAHVRYDVDAHGNWCFCDKDRHEAETGGFRVRTTDERLSEFLSEIGVYLTSTSIGRAGAE